MSHTSLNVWATKARALDRYRWRQHRQRHHLIGASLRFLRDALVDLWFGWQAKSCLVSVVANQPCDVLLLQAAPKVIGLQRKRALKAQLRARGYRLTEVALQPMAEILSQGQLVAPPFSVPLRYLGYAAHAQWLVMRHDPWVLLNDRNGSLFSPFLHLALQARQRPLVHLAHATTLEDSQRLGMNDYDYYFVFGQSSLEALQARPLRFGQSIVVLAGSHMVDRSFDLAPANPEQRQLLVLGVGPDKEKEAGYQHTYGLLREWAANHPDYQLQVRLHPRSRGEFWMEAAQALDNLQVLSPHLSLAEALREASLVINIMSNAVIEAALARRPVLVVNGSNHQDIFSQARFFGSTITDIETLEARIAAVYQDYSTALEQSWAFAEYHLANGVNGLDETVHLLEQLLQGKTCSGILLSECWGEPSTDPSSI